MEEKILDEITLKRLHNLKMFRDKTDDDIREFYRNRRPVEKKAKKAKTDKVEIPAEILKSGSDDEAYDKNFKAKLLALQEEYGIDMNNSNDVELLRSLVRHIIQQENVNNQIIGLQSEDEIDTRTLKNLGDYQRTLVTSITDIQEKLGIARKLRKEKQVDDVAVFMETLKARAKEFMERKTIQVRCPKCKIELTRHWLNFPALTKVVHVEVECWKCHETTVYTL